MIRIDLEMFRILQRAILMRLESASHLSAPAYGAVLQVDGPIPHSAAFRRRIRERNGEGCSPEMSNGQGGSPARLAPVTNLENRHKSFVPSGWPVPHRC